MTPEQIEIASRRLCKMRGNDPDKWSVAPRGRMGKVPMWHMYKNEVVKVWQTNQAIAYALNESSELKEQSQ